MPGGHSSNLGRFLDVAYNVEYGADTVNQSSLALVLLMGYQPNPGHFNVWGLSDERYHIVGGNDQLPDAVAAALPSGSVQIGWKLLAVRANSDGTQTLTFDNGGTTKTVTADHTIITVPLPILQGLDLSQAGFDSRMTALLRDARMGACTKLNMQFSSRPWVGTGPCRGSRPATASPTCPSSSAGTPPRARRDRPASSSSTAAAASPVRSTRRHPSRPRTTPTCARW
ncbi:FAD-dependent oxidoreductase [Nonomuraea pusilla]|uniref:FAD-dependent oxidoreductase n=1 Tax=Nonomuraea pusilla TaxID=46177 RepID=UPI003323284F